MDQANTLILSFFLSFSSSWFNTTKKRKEAETFKQGREEQRKEGRRDRELGGRKNKVSSFVLASLITLLCLLVFSLSLARKRGCFLVV